MIDQIRLRELELDGEAQIPGRTVTHLKLRLDEYLIVVRLAKLGLYFKMCMLPIVKMISVLRPTKDFHGILVQQVAQALNKLPKE